MQDNSLDPIAIFNNFPEYEVIGNNVRICRIKDIFRNDEGISMIYFTDGSSVKIETEFEKAIQAKPNLYWVYNPDQERSFIIDLDYFTNNYEPVRDETQLDFRTLGAIIYEDGEGVTVRTMPIIGENNETVRGQFYAIGKDKLMCSSIQMQRGDVEENNVNGWSPTSLLAIVIDSIQELNKVSPCPDYEEAILKMAEGFSILADKIIRDSILIPLN